MRSSDRVVGLERGGRADAGGNWYALELSISFFCFIKDYFAFSYSKSSGSDHVLAVSDDRRHNVTRVTCLARYPPSIPAQ